MLELSFEVLCISRLNFLNLVFGIFIALYCFGDFISLHCFWAFGNMYCKYYDWYLSIVSIVLYGATSYQNALNTYYVIFSL
jgi:hypothetical protein